MRMFLVLVVALVVGGCRAEGEAEDRCRRDCPTYNAEFVRVSCNGDSCSEHVEQWGCWCRRRVDVVEPAFVHAEEPDCTVFDTDRGEVCKTIRHGSEPLRIW